MCRWGLWGVDLSFDAVISDFKFEESFDVGLDLAVIGNSS